VAEGLAAFSIANVSGSLIGPLAGRLSDRLGDRRTLLMVAEAASLPFFISIPFAGNFLEVSLFFLIADTLLSIGQTALQAFIADITPDAQRGRGYGFVNAIGAAGAIVGTLIAGTVAQAFGLVAIFYMVGFLMIGTILLVVLAVPKQHLPKGENTRKPIREMKGLAIFSVATSIRTLGTGAVIAFLGTYAAILHANNFEVSLVAIAGLVTTALLGTRLGGQVDKLGEIRAYVLGTIIVVFSLIIYVVASDWIDLIPAGIVYSSGFAMLSPAMLSWVTKIAPENRKAEYLGFFSMINSTLWSLGALPGGIVEASYGTFGLFVYALVTTVISLLSVYMLYSRRSTKSKSETPEQKRT